MSQNTVSFEQEPRIGEWNENAFNRSFRHEVATAGNVRIHPDQVPALEQDHGPRTRMQQYR